MSSPTASVVGNRFVLKYYTTLNSNPNELFHFYKENSSFTHGYEGVTTEEDEVYGTEEIDKRIRSLEYSDCKVTLSVVDCQDSLDGGVVVLVVGHMANKGEEPRKFVQIFYLAVQTKPGVGYFVRNEIFRYLDEGSDNRNESPLENANSIPSAPVVSPPPENPEFQASVPIQSTSVIPPAVTPPSIPHIPSQVVEPPTGISAVPSQVTPPSQRRGKGQPKKQTETPPAPPASSSWASLVTGPGSPSAPIASPANVPPANVPPSNVPPAKVAPTPVATSAQGSPQTSSRGKHQRVLDGRSLYVSNIPFSATQQQLEKLFSQFGPLVEVALQKVQ